MSFIYPENFIISPKPFACHSHSHSGGPSFNHGPGGFSPYSSILQLHVHKSPYLLTLLECKKPCPPLVF